MNMNFTLTNPLQGSKLTKWPVGNITQGYGENPQLYQRLVGIQYHNGIDIAMLFRTPVLAAYDGTIYAVENQLAGYGKVVREISDKIDGVYYGSPYGHLDEIVVSRGQRVKAGDLLGYSGNTGFVWSGDKTVFWGNAPANKGVHLHFGLRILEDATDKSNIAILGKNYIIRDYDNGVNGYVDPMPFFNQITQKTMFYGIDAEKNQWLYDNTVKLAISIADEKELAFLKEKGVVSGEPTEVDLTDYVIYRGATEERLKDFFNLK